MTSDKQYAANRANAMASTGPKSAPGKAIARLNALTHGAFATQRLLRDEDASQYEELSTRVLAETEPKTAIESMLADQIIADMWRINRIERAELALFERLRESNFALTLRDLPSEEFELAEKIIDNREQLHVAKRQRQMDWLEEPRPRLTSSQREVISNIVKRKLDRSRDLETLLLDAMASEHQAAPYTALEGMRRTLVRDVVRQYANLLEIQGRRRSIESTHPE